MELKLKPFLELCDQTVGAALASFGFTATKSDSHDEWCVKRFYQIGTRYVAISANAHFRDVPLHCGVRLGDDSLDWPEYDWNGIALWHLINDTPHEYSLDSVEHLPVVLSSIASDLPNQADDFLSGELTRFLAARSRVNSNREPYKIHSPNSDGDCETTLHLESSDLKKRFS